MIKNKNFLIIDGNSLAHRAYHSIPQTLTTRKGDPINAVYGFTKMFLKTIEVFSPTYVACAFDLKGPTFRNNLFPDYKKNRKKLDDSLALQLDQIKDLLKAFNVPIYELKGYEGDDIIGSLKREIILTDPSLDIIILTGDRDILQLLEDKVTVVMSGKTFSDFIIYDANKFVEKYNFQPKSLVDFKAIHGDKSDNIPGVSGIGEKGATDLILKYNSLERVYESLEELPKKLVDKLSANKEMAFLSKELATIKEDLKVNILYKECELKNFDEAQIKNKFIELNFNSLLKNLPKVVKNESMAGNRGDDVNIDIQCHEILSFKEVLELKDKLNEQKLFFLTGEKNKNTETESEYIAVAVVLLGGSSHRITLSRSGLLNEKGELVLPIAEDSDDWGNIVNLFRGQENKIVTHSAKELILLLSSIFEMNCDFYIDLEMASYLLGFPRNDVESLSFDLGFLSSDSNIDLLMKSFLISKIYENLIQRINEDEKVKKILFDIEMPLIRVLFEMEKVGVKLDRKYLDNIGKKIELDIEKIKKEIFSIVGHEFNISSPKQLSGILFEELGLPKGRKTKTGYSTDEGYFMMMGDIHPIISKLRQYRELVKLKNTYIDVLPKLTDGNSRIHTTYRQALTATGRLSSNNPNLQNIPIRTALGNDIRNAFVADNYSIFLSFDYSQIELRILAELSEDNVLIDAFNKSVDIHESTAQMIFGKDIISKEERRIAKTINFGVIYGISPYGLTKQLSITRDLAKEFIDKYFLIYSGVAKYIQTQKDFVEEKEYVESYYGRKRFFKGIKYANWTLRESMFREAVNMPIQGTNADIIKIAMKRIADSIEKSNFPCKMILQVHDELIFEYMLDKKYFKDSDLNIGLIDLFKADSTLFSFYKKTKSLMEDVVKFSVPLKVDLSVGRRWGTLERIDQNMFAGA